MKKILGMIVLFCIGGAGGFFIGDIIGKMEMNFKPILLIVFLVIAILLHAIIHEGGHLIAGLLSGYKFSSFRIGSFIIYKRKGAVKFGKFKISGTGGQCLLTPPPLVNDRYPFIFYNAGGGILNILVALFAYKGYYDLKMVQPTWAVFFLSMAIVGAFLGTINLFPLKTSEVPNDGYNILSARKNPENAKKLWIQLEVNSRQFEGERLKDMPEEWFQYDEQDLNVLNQSIGLFKFARLCEGSKGELEKARILGEQILNEQGMFPLIVNEIKCGLLYIACLDETSHEKAKEMFNDKALARYIKATKNYVARKSLLYAYYSLVEEDIAKAAKEKEMFKKLVDTYPNLAEIETEAECISKIDEMLKQKGVSVEEYGK